MFQNKKQTGKENVNGVSVPGKPGRDAVPVLDNRTKYSVQRKLLNIFPAATPQQKNDHAGIQKEADFIPNSAIQLKVLKMDSMRYLSNSSTVQQHDLSKKNNVYLSGQSVLQARFYQKTGLGAPLVLWNIPMMMTGFTHHWRPWIDPATGRQGLHGGLGIWFNFDKTNLTPQRIKGTRNPASGDTPGLTLGNLADFNAAGMALPFPGAHNFPGGMGTATNARAAVPAAVQAPSSWGHQLAAQWGGPANQANSTSATNHVGAGAAAQEEYQTTAEDAITRVAADDHVPLSSFRLKHTAYNYPGTHVAKYVRFKIYVKSPIMGWYKVVDHITPDFAEFLGGGRAQLNSARQVFQITIENQLRAYWFSSLKAKHKTDPTEIMSWNTVNIAT